MFEFETPLVEGVIERRKSQFTMLVSMGGQEGVACHCPTTGRIGNLDVSGRPCLLSASTDPKRKTPYTVEAVSLDRPEDERKSWIGIMNLNSDLTHLSLATRSARSSSAQPPRAFGTDAYLPDSTSRAARSASFPSSLPSPAGLPSRLGRSTSSTLKPLATSSSASPAPYEHVPSTPTAAHPPGSPIASASSA